MLKAVDRVDWPPYVFGSSSEVHELNCCCQTERGHHMCRRPWCPVDPGHSGAGPRDPALVCSKGGCLRGSFESLRTPHGAQTFLVRGMSYNVDQLVLTILALLSSDSGSLSNESTAWGYFESP